MDRKQFLLIKLQAAQKARQVIEKFRVQMQPIQPPQPVEVPEEAQEMENAEEALPIRNE